MRLTPEGSSAANYAFDVTPARLVTGLVTERGVCPASRNGLLSLIPSTARRRPNRVPVMTIEEEFAIRRAIIRACLTMNAHGINQGKSGNISVRTGNSILITPSGLPYDEMQPEDIALMPLEGEYGSWVGPFVPSTEWRFHLDIMRARPDVGSIVHTHSLYATAFAICGHGFRPSTI